MNAHGNRRLVIVSVSTRSAVCLRVEDKLPDVVPGYILGSFSPAGCSAWWERYFIMRSADWCCCDSK